MAKTARKAETQVPRRRVISKAPTPPVKKTSFSIEFSTVVLFVLAVFLVLSLGSQLMQFGTPAELKEQASHSRANVMGPVGAAVASTLLKFLGYCAFVLVAWSLLLARSIAAGWKPFPENRMAAFTLTILSSFVMLCSAAAIASVLFGFSGGGAVGTSLAITLIHYVNEPGAVLIATTVLVVSLGIATGVGALSLMKALQRVALLCSLLVQDAARLVWGLTSLFFRPFRRSSEPNEPTDEDVPYTLEDAPRPVRKPRVVEPVRTDKIEAEPEKRVPAVPVRIMRKSDEEAELAAASKKKMREESAKAPKPRTIEFEKPSGELLVRGESSLRSAPKDKELLQNSKRLEETLENFRIGGKVVEVQPGPVITLYQFEPAPGVKVQRVVTLADDLALALRVASVRIYAPVPGKGTVGIEVPNAHREIVRLRDLIETRAFRDEQQQIALALGKDTFGDPFVADLSKMPHLLIAGATGTGKSVCINSLLLSLLYRNTPAELRLILIDPKMLELSVYEDIPHLKAPVVTQAKRARGVLYWAVEEMERRYGLMKTVGVRNLASFNDLIESANGGSNKISARTRAKVIELLEKDVVATSNERPALDRTIDETGAKASRKANIPLETLPRIVIVVDELADLMLTVGREIEELLTRLAQKARAAGIHLILATQRPSVNVITGLIKANFPSRISFKVASRIDARTVMDTSGAEKLLGQGDMLFLSPGAGRPRRLHSPFVSDKEVHDVVEFLRGQGRPDYDAQIESMIERFEQQESQGTGPDGAPEEYDALYDQAVQYVVEKGVASTSMIQRIFRIGYNRAARILETMERDGVVGPADGARPRQILAPNHDAEI